MKYKGLVFRDPDTLNKYYICKDNMEFRRGRGYGWMVIGTWADNPGPKEDLKPFTLELACELIAVYPQKDGMQIICEDDGV